MKITIIKKIIKQSQCKIGVDNKQYKNISMKLVENMLTLNIKIII